MSLPSDKFGKVLKCEQGEVDARRARLQFPSWKPESCAEEPKPNGCSASSPGGAPPPGVSPGAEAKALSKPPPDDPDLGPALQEARGKRLVGLALSGGGIRSATFNL